MPSCEYRLRHSHSRQDTSSGNWAMNSISENSESEDLARFGLFLSTGGTGVLHHDSLIQSRDIYQSDLSTTCVGAPARGDTRGIDGIKCDACRTGSTCAIRPVGTREDVDTWITAEYQGSECVRTRHRLL